jgi:hypothetical protein
MTNVPHFIDALPSQLARDCFIVWRNARQGGVVPSLWDFAPTRLPPPVLPFILIERLRADGEFIYGLAGEEVVRWFGENPKGKPVLGNTAPPKRESRIALLRQSISSGMPFWFWGTLLLDNKEHMPIGRLGLPASDKAEQLLLLIYFVLGAEPMPRRRVIDGDNLEAAQIMWCAESDLAGSRSGC